MRTAVCVRDFCLCVIEYLKLNLNIQNTYAILKYKKHLLFKQGQEAGHVSLL